MPSSREIQERRHQAIRNLLSNNEPPIEDQKDLVKRLKAMGIPATQSSVSRDLRELGAEYVSGHYEFPSWNTEESPFWKTRRLVGKMATAGPHQILLVTQPGAGPFVAEALEASQWEDIVGTVAGHSSVLILTQHKFFQDLVWRRLSHILGEGTEKVEDTTKKEGEQSSAGD